MIRYELYCTHVTATVFHAFIKPHLDNISFILILTTHAFNDIASSQYEMKHCLSHMLLI